MKLIEFFGRVTPNTIGGIAWKCNGMDGGREFSYFRHAVIGSPEEAVNKIKELIAQNKDIYYTPASFKQGFHTNGSGKKIFRVRSNVDKLRALWFDIDFKAGLSTPKQVIAALKEFSGKTGFPPPSILVHSGNGIHAYWPFTRDLDVLEWKQLAEALKNKAHQEGLAVDLPCTADACRILRPPGTKNFKDANNPKPVYFLYVSSRNHDPDQLARILGDNVNLPDYLRGYKSDVVNEYGGGSTPNKIDDALAANISKKCGVIKWYFKTGGAECTEPEWKDGLQLLSHCTDGELYYHEISKGHPDYTPDATTRKFEQRLSSGVGPTLCSTFELYRPDICNKCPFKGKIKTPLILGVDTATIAPEGVVLSTWRPVPNGNGMERKMLNPETNQFEWVKVLQLTYDEVFASRSIVTKQFEIHFKVKTIGAEDIEVVMPSSHLGNDNKLKELMAGFGAPLLSAEIQPFKALMSTWLKQLRGVRAVENVTEQLGWVRGNDNTIEGFAAGDTSFMSDGTQKEGVRAGREFQALARMYKPSGSIEPWKRVAQFIAEQDNPSFTSVLASAFAAPLLHFTGVPGAILSIVSAESGVGKSSALKCAQAVWGSPTQGMNSVDDTRLSVARKLGFLNNIPAYWDELRGKATMDSFVTLAFQISQGKEKTRLDSSAKMRDVNTWETMLVAASNESIFEYMANYSGGSDAGVARVFEITVDPFDTDKSRAEIAMLFEVLSQNYGYPGQVYAAYLGVNHEKVRERVSNMFTKLDRAVKMGAAERIWVACMACLIVGAQIAKELKLVDINLHTLSGFLMRNLTGLRARSHSTMLGSSPSELIAAYMQQHQDKGLIVKKLMRGRGPGYVPVQIGAGPKSDRIVYQLAVEENVVRVSKGDFTAWLRKHKEINFSSVQKDFMKIGTVQVRTYLGIGTKWHMPRQVCLDIPVDYNIEGIEVDN